jgi:deazaflavin-dependent oxidoreductase (nitroreductase family)
MTTAGLPPRVALVSRVPRRLLAAGLPMGPLTLLRTRGRRSGKLRTVPVTTLRHDGLDWLVSPFGDTHWVHNIRADNHAELGRGHRLRRVRLIEVNDARKPAVLWHYRRTFRFVSFVRHAFDATPGQGPQAFQQEAHRHPIFLIQPEV